MSFTRQLASVVAVAVFSSAQDIINVGPGDSIQNAIVGGTFQGPGYGAWVW